MFLDRLIGGGESPSDVHSVAELRYRYLLEIYSQVNLQTPSYALANEVPSGRPRLALYNYDAGILNEFDTTNDTRGPVTWVRTLCRAQSPETKRIEQAKKKGR